MLRWGGDEDEFLAWGLRSRLNGATLETETVGHHTDEGDHDPQDIWRRPIRSAPFFLTLKMRTSVLR